METPNLVWFNNFFIAWKEMTTGNFGFHEYAGTHFFLHDDQKVEPFLKDVQNIIMIERK
jgi:surfactin synthase thioesterase subunit